MGYLPRVPKTSRFLRGEMVDWVDQLRHKRSPIIKQMEGKVPIPGEPLPYYLRAGLIPLSSLSVSRAGCPADIHP